MAKPELLETLHTIANPIVQSKGLDIWGIELLSGTRPLVRLYVEKNHKSSENISETTEDCVETQEELRALSASVEECAKISRMLGLALDVEDIFSQAYILEVSSPGFSRIFFQLAQLQGYEGDTIEISLVDFLQDCPPTLYGRKKIKGILRSVQLEEETLTVSTNDGEQAQDITIHFQAARRIVRVHIFVMPEKPGKKNKK